MGLLAFAIPKGRARFRRPLTPLAGCRAQHVGVATGCPGTFEANPGTVCPDDSETMG